MLSGSLLKFAFVTEHCSQLSSSLSRSVLVLTLCSVLHRGVSSVGLARMTSSNRGTVAADDASSANNTTAEDSVDEEETPAS